MDNIPAPLANTDPATEKLRNALLSIKFTEDEVTAQIEGLNEQISMAVVGRILQAHPDQHISIDQLPDFLKAQDPNLMADLVKDESAKTLNQYLAEVSAGLTEAERQAFLTQL